MQTAVAPAEVKLSNRDRFLNQADAVLVRTTGEVSEEAAQEFCAAIPGLSAGSKEMLLSGRHAIEVRVLPEIRERLENLGKRLGFSVQDKPGFNPSKEREQRERRAARPRAPRGRGYHRRRSMGLHKVDYLA